MTVTVCARSKQHPPSRKAKLSLRESQEAKERPQIQEVGPLESALPNRQSLWESKRLQNLTMAPVVVQHSRKAKEHCAQLKNASLAEKSNREKEKIHFAMLVNTTFGFLFKTN